VQPQPIRTTADNAFAHDTMVRRLPANIRNIIASHTEYSDEITARLEQLAADIAGNAIIPPLPLPAADAEHWHAAYDRRAGERWHDTDWFFGETYGFRLILSAARFFETLIDPFAPMKERELASGAPFLPVERFFGEDGPGKPLLSAAERVANAASGLAANAKHPANTENRRASMETSPFAPNERRALLEAAIHVCIWGNRADISFTAGGELDHSAGDSALLLSDDSAAAADLLATNKHPVHIVMDNSGAELAGDLVLALAITTLTGAAVVLHPKAYPTYVSDTIVADVHTWLHRAAAYSVAHPDAAHPAATQRAAAYSVATQRTAAAQRTAATQHATSPSGDDVIPRFSRAVSAAFSTGMITLAPDHYWCETEFLTEMPPRLTRLFSDAGLVIVKGDFNYRRATRDTIWAPDTTIKDAMGLTQPQPPWLLLRTMKSDCLAGVPSTKTNQLDRDEPGWRTAGRHGVIQLIDNLV
jgi:hypothetical protein